MTGIIQNMALYSTDNAQKCGAKASKSVPTTSNKSQRFLIRQGGIHPAGILQRQKLLRAPVNIMLSTTAPQLDPLMPAIPHAINIGSQHSITGSLVSLIKPPLWL